MIIYEEIECLLDNKRHSDEIQKLQAVNGEKFEPIWLLSLFLYYQLVIH